MGVREDFFCDDFKTVPVPHLNRQFEYEEISCAGNEINGNLKIPGLAKCEPTYECNRWQDAVIGDDYVVPEGWGGDFLWLVPKRILTLFPMQYVHTNRRCSNQGQEMRLYEMRLNS